jgi:Putative auto-transporter adhesin, head GIN domain
MHTAPTPTQGHVDVPRHPLRWLLVVALAVAGTLLVQHEFFQGGSSTTGTVEGSGVAATVTRHLPPFTAVDLAGTNEMVVRVGGPQAVVVHADDNLLRVVATTVRSGELVVADRGSFRTVSPMLVEVRVPALDSVTLSGTGRLTASGRAGHLQATLTGTGNLELQGLVARSASAVLAGTGQIWLNVTEALDASIRGTGAIRYSGGPARVTQDVSGTGAVIAQ